MPKSNRYKSKPNIQKSKVTKINKPIITLRSIVFAIIFALAGTILIVQSNAATTIPYTLEAEGMTLTNQTIISDASSSGGKAVAFYRNGEINTQLSLTDKATSISIRAKGNQCKGAPIAIVKIDGSPISFSVSSSSWSNYSYNFSTILPAGNHGITLSYANDFTNTQQNKRKNCDRNLYVDSPVFNLSPPDTTISTPQPQTTPIVSPTPAPAPTSSTHFTLLPVGSSLPSDSECVSRIRRHGWEYDSKNTTNNQTRGSQLQNSYIHEFDSTIANRVNGDFTGTTDEILQWGACKWGFDEDDVRAQAVTESTWRQYFNGDCNRQSNTQFGLNGCESVGILQVKGANIPPTHPGTWPDAYNSTAFNVDYTLAIRRLCFEGKEYWLGNGYQAGDLWGCIGRWYSGDWYVNSQEYINTVKLHLQNKPWIGWGYPN